jgi:hypothetical protein
MKRPVVFDLNSAMVSRPANPEPAKTPDPEPASKAEAETFRTSIYFARPVHDVLREIAFAERKAIADLVREGLDHVLAARGFPSTAELRKGKA